MFIETKKKKGGEGATPVLRKPWVCVEGGPRASVRRPSLARIRQGALLCGLLAADEWQNRAFILSPVSLCWEPPRMTLQVFALTRRRQERRVCCWRFYFPGGSLLWKDDRLPRKCAGYFLHRICPYELVEMIRGKWRGSVGYGPYRAEEGPTVISVTHVTSVELLTPEQLTSVNYVAPQDMMTSWYNS